MDLFDFAREQGEKARDAGLAQVSAHNPSWMENGLKLIETKVAPGTELMGEDLRTVPGIGEPDHPNAWGALVRAAIQRQLIQRTGEFRKAKRKSIHAHHLAVYRRTAP